MTSPCTPQVDSNAIALEHIQQHGPSRPIDIGLALVSAGLATRTTAADEGRNVCRRLVRAGMLIHTGRGLYRERSADDEAMVCVPGRGELRVGELRELRSAAAVFAGTLARAHGRGSPGLDERLQGEYVSASAFAAMLDLIIEGGTGK